jgi:hypothetical protein
MHKLTWLTTTVAALSCLAFVPATHTTPQDPAPAAAKKADEPSLEQRMKAMKKAFNKVRDFAAKGEGAAPMAEVDSLLTHALAARNQIPERAAEVAEADRAKWLLAYKQSMRDTVRTLLELEQALEQADKEKIKALAETLGKQQKDGHKAYKTD